MRSAAIFLLFSLINHSIGHESLFPLSIIHINDIHAKFEQTNLQANTCKNESSCIGGYARAVTVIRQLRRSQPNPLYLNAGDNFQGTLWYTLFKWNVTQHLLNLEPADVMVSFASFFAPSVSDSWFHAPYLSYRRPLEITNLITESMD
jgi:5'-nucleotidase